MKSVLSCIKSFIYGSIASLSFHRDGEDKRKHHSLSGSTTWLVALQCLCFFFDFTTNTTFPQRTEDLVWRFKLSENLSKLWKDKRTDPTPGALLRSPPHPHYIDHWNTYIHKCTLWGSEMKSLHSRPQVRKKRAKDETLTKDRTQTFSSRCSRVDFHCSWGNILQYTFFLLLLLFIKYIHRHNKWWPETQTWWHSGPCWADLLALNTSSGGGSWPMSKAFICEEAEDVIVSV